MDIQARKGRSDRLRLLILHGPRNNLSVNLTNCLLESLNSIKILQRPSFLSEEYRCGLTYSHTIALHAGTWLVTTREVGYGLPGDYLLAPHTQPANHRPAGSQPTNQKTAFVSYDTGVFRILWLEDNYRFEATLPATMS